MFEYFIPAILLALGVAVHWLKQLIMARKLVGVHALSVRDYWLKHWPETLVAIFSAVGGFAFLYEQEALSSINAFGMGFIANSIADVMGTRVQAMVGGTPSAVARKPNP